MAFSSFFLLLFLLLSITLFTPTTTAARRSPAAEIPPERSSKSTMGRHNHHRKPSSSSLFLPLRTQQVSSSSSTLASKKNKIYFHHTNVSLTVALAVGSPPQNVSMVLDTGSELSWVLSSSFNRSSSSSFLPIPFNSSICHNNTHDLPSPPYEDPSTGLCHVALSYADASSVDGDLALDLFHIGESESPAIFGWMNSTYSSDGAATSGLMGMNRGALSLVTQMGTHQFSYCISGGEGSTGVLLIGETETDLPFTIALNYTPLVQIELPLPYFDRVAYSVELQGIRVGGKVLPIPKSVLAPDHTGAGQTMVDSGTQFTFLLGPAYGMLKTEFLRQTESFLTVLDDPDFVFQGAFDACFSVPATAPSPPPGLPEVTMMFNGAEMAVKGERLLYRAEGEDTGGDGIWCLTFGNSDLVPMEAYVIGHHHQQNVWVEYDLLNGRVGFAPMECDVARQLLGGFVGNLDR